MELLTIKEIAKLSGTSDTTIRNYVLSRVIQPVTWRNPDKQWGPLFAADAVDSVRALLQRPGHRHPLNDGLLSSKEVCKATGLTYRQLDNAARNGYLVPAVDSAGSGISRRWSSDIVKQVEEYLQRIKDCPLSHAASYSVTRKGNHL